VAFAKFFQLQKPPDFPTIALAQKKYPILSRRTLAQIKSRAWYKIQQSYKIQNVSDNGQSVIRKAIPKCKGDNADNESDEDQHPALGNASLPDVANQKARPRTAMIGCEDDVDNWSRIRPRVKMIGCEDDDDDAEFVTDYNVAPEQTNHGECSKAYIPLRTKMIGCEDEDINNVQIDEYQRAEYMQEYECGYENRPVAKMIGCEDDYDNDGINDYTSLNRNNEPSGSMKEFESINAALNNCGVTATSSRSTIQDVEGVEHQREITKDHKSGMF